MFQPLPRFRNEMETRENVNIFLKIFLIPVFEMKGRQVKMYESLSKLYAVGHENNLSNHVLFVTSKMPL